MFNFQKNPNFIFKFIEIKNNTILDTYLTYFKN